MNLDVLLFSRLMGFLLLSRLGLESVNRHIQLIRWRLWDLVCVLLKLFWPQNWRAGLKSGWTPSTWGTGHLGCPARLSRAWGDKASKVSPAVCSAYLLGSVAWQLWGASTLYISWDLVHSAGLVAVCLSSYISPGNKGFYSIWLLQETGHRG